MNSSKAMSNKSYANNPNHNGGSQIPQNIQNNTNLHQATPNNNSNLFNSYNKTITYDQSPMHGNFTESAFLSNNNSGIKVKTEVKEEPIIAFQRLFDFPSITLQNLNDYSIKGCIGKGAYAKVYVAKKRSTNKLYAIKVYQKDYLTKPHRITNIQNEISIGAMLKHPNIIKLFYINETADSVNIVMEYGGKTSIERLIEKLSNSKKVPEMLAAKIFYYCLIGLNFLHNQNIYHRDIK